MSFLNSFTENVRKYPDKVALEFIDPPLQRLTYAELDERVKHVQQAICKASDYSPATAWLCSFPNASSSSLCTWQR
jgi:acyl-CoA synthetase (AMP-forming)/AMP-acid ligase II